ncbi:uncharacterized protein LOC102911309 isoform X1 [Peromyscus maniculatus bairdii]|uniref:uncharacterized protein LOC102911309 isoform X1 n=1 Tax=Peromyscus maniculatus bairdii TaxID=230844 RepID=UPI003FD07950
MATAAAAAETARAAANGGNCCFGPVPGGGSTRLRWLPPGPAARDGRAAILEERRPRPPATCAPIGRRAGRGRLVTVSMAPARAGTGAGAGPHATRLWRAWPGPRRGRRPPRRLRAAAHLPDPGETPARPPAPRAREARRPPPGAVAETAARPPAPPRLAPKLGQELIPVLPARRDACAGRDRRMQAS